jgi:hypothetical protein
VWESRSRFVRHFEVTAVHMKENAIPVTFETVRPTFLYDLKKEPPLTVSVTPIKRRGETAASPAATAIVP